MTDQEIKQSNRTLVIAVIVAILLTSLAWWFLSKPAKPIQPKGSFPAVAVKPSETKPLPELRFIHDGFKTIIDSSEVSKFRELYNLTKSDFDSIAAANVKLDSLANITNDKYFQKLYSDCKFVEFSHVFGTDTSKVKATVSGMSRGAPMRLKLDYVLNIPPPKETVFGLWGGVEAGMTTSFSKFNAKVNLDFQTGKKLMIKSSFDTDKRIYLGVSTNFLDIKR